MQQLNSHCVLLGRFDWKYSTDLITFATTHLLTDIVCSLETVSIAYLHVPSARPSNELQRCLREEGPAFCPPTAVDVRQC
eukprot:COSAG03_NODE_20537_length_317_cov_1.247706_1_plen_79_part_10